MGDAVVLDCDAPRSWAGGDLLAPASQHLDQVAQGRPLQGPGADTAPVLDEVPVAAQVRADLARRERRVKADRPATPATMRSPPDDLRTRQLRKKTH